MYAQLQRRSALAGGAAGLLGVLALGACTREDDENVPEWEDLGAELTPVDPEDAPAVDSLPEEGRTTIEAPEGVFHLAGVLITASFAAAQVEQMLPLHDPPPEDVRAPDGQTFLLAAVGSSQVLWPQVSADQGFSSTYRVLVRRPGSEVYRTEEVDPGRLEELQLMRVPADPAPADALLEVDIAGKFQQLSLIDGSRVRSDVEHLDERVTAVEYAADGEASNSLPVIRVEREDEVGTGDEVTLSVEAAMVTPMTPRLGWPAAGHQLTGLTVEPRHWFTREFMDSVQLPAEPGDCHLSTPDGQRLEPVDVVRSYRNTNVGVFGGDTYILWFEVPADIASATVHVALSPFPRTDGLADALQAGDAEIDLTFTSDPALSG